jgi:hypothetical protein
MTARVARVRVTYELALTRHRGPTRADLARGCDITAAIGRLQAIPSGCPAGTATTTSKEKPRATRRDSWTDRQGPTLKSASGQHLSPPSHDRERSRLGRRQAAAGSRSGLRFSLSGI